MEKPFGVPELKPMSVEILREALSGADDDRLITDFQL